MDQRLRGKLALITGGASGIGEAIATLFAACGACVAIADVQTKRGETVAARLREAGEEACFFSVDLANAEQAAALVPQVGESLGGLDVLVNGAALFGWLNKKTAVETPLPVWDQTLDVNLKAPLLLSRAAIPLMRSRGGGSIINIASIGGIGVFPEFAAYSVSKAALIQLTRSLAVDYGGAGIRVNAICPGAIDTPGNDPFVKNREEYLKLIASATPMRRTGTPEEIAWAALYLASEESSYVSGTTLVIDGGRTAKA
jgi:NAD(P)-dependent dehydrogenase (short-subunit alcohol dehydrogenase family)